MIEKAKWPWFRFHLLTLVLMALAAGGAIWVNTRMEKSIHLPGQFVIYADEYGWPMTFVSSGRICPISTVRLRT